MQSTQKTPAIPTISSTEAPLLDPVIFDSQSALRSYWFAPNTKTPKPNDHKQAFTEMRCLPVRGRAEGGKDGNFVIEEQPIDWTYRPADLQGVNEAFAVFVSGNSMVPKYKNGDLVYVHPAKPISKQRYALIETTEHKGFIKQYVGWQDDHLIVQQFNPKQEIKIPRENVLRLMLVIGSLDC